MGPGGPVLADPQVSRERKARLVENAEALVAALRQARERANHAAAPPVSIGREAFTFLLG